MLILIFPCSLLDETLVEVIDSWHVERPLPADAAGDGADGLVGGRAGVGHAHHVARDGAGHAQVVGQGGQEELKTSTCCILIVD